MYLRCNLIECKVIFKKKIWPSKSVAFLCLVCLFVLFMFFCFVCCCSFLRHRYFCSPFQGQTVLWSWKDSESEKHNIVHVNPPDHAKCYMPVTGPDAYSSGDPQVNYSCMQTFQEPGSYYYTSEGATGSVSTVNVLEKGKNLVICENTPI